MRIKKEGAISEGTVNEGREEIEKKNQQIQSICSLSNP